MGTLLLGVIAGVLCGIIASVLGSYGFYLVLLTPLVIGLGVGSIMAKGILWTKNRSPLITTVAATLASLAAVSAVHITDYVYYQAELKYVPVEERQFALGVKMIEANPEMEMPIEIRELLADPEFDHQWLAAIQVETFPEYMQYQAEQGVSFSRVGRGDEGANLGYYGTMIYWLIEACIIAGVAISLVRQQSSAPFCVPCDQWNSVKLLGEVALSANQVASIIQEGKVTSLSTVMPEQGLTELQLYRCEACGSPGNSVIGVDEISYYRGQRQRKRKGTFVVTDEMVSALAAILEQSDDELAVLTAVEEVADEFRKSAAMSEAATSQTANADQPEQPAELI